jgi:hypothetical protein
MIDLPGCGVVTGKKTIRPISFLIIGEDCDPRGNSCDGIHRPKGHLRLSRVTPGPGSVAASVF